MVQHTAPLSNPMGDLETFLASLFRPHDFVDFSLVVREHRPGGADTTNVTRITSLAGKFSPQL